MANLGPGLSWGASGNGTESPYPSQRNAPGNGVGGAKDSLQAADENDDTIINDPPKLNQTDQYGRTIDRIYWATRKFYIYQAAGEVRYLLPEDYDTAAALRRNLFGLIEPRANIERLRKGEGISPGDSERAATELAGAMAQAFETNSTSVDDTKTLVAALHRTEEILLSLVKSHFRKRYILGAISAFLFVVFVLLVMMAIFDYSSDPQGQIELAAVGRYSGYCIFGAFGALFSVASRIDSIDFRMDIGRWEYFVGGLTRIGIGVVAGIVIGLVLNSKFVVLNFGLDDEGTFLPVVAYLLAFVAGFSESLVPNLLARGEEMTLSSTSSPGTDKAKAS